MSTFSIDYIDYISLKNCVTSINTYAAVVHQGVVLIKSAILDRCEHICCKIFYCLFAVQKGLNLILSLRATISVNLIPLKRFLAIRQVSAKLDLTLTLFTVKQLIYLSICWVPLKICKIEAKCIRKTAKYYLTDFFPLWGNPPPPVPPLRKVS